MASTFDNDLRLEEMATGENAGSWGTKTNTNLELIADAFGYGTFTIADADTTLTMPDGSDTDNALRSLYLKISSSADLTTTRTLTLAPNTVSKLWYIENNTSGGQTITISQGSGANVNILNGQAKLIATDGAGAGAAVIDVTQDLAIPDLFIDDDLSLQSDGAIINFGADADVNLTHVADTGLRLNDAMALEFRDGDLSINSSADGQLDINADTEVQITAPTVDIDASTEVNISADLKVDTDTLYVDSTNNRVGIGTSSPDFKTVIRQDSAGAIAQVLQLENNETIATGKGLKIGFGLGDSEGSTRGYIETALDSSTGTYMAFATNDGSTGTYEAMRIDRDGKVGIGTTTTSSSKVHISTSDGAAPTNATAYTGALRLTSTATAGVGVGPSLMFRGQTGNASSEYSFAAIQGIKSSSGTDDYSGSLVFYTQISGGATLLSEVMRIDSNLRVGIGVTAPQSKVEINQGSASFYSSAGDEFSRSARAANHLLLNTAGFQNATVITAESGVGGSPTRSTTGLILNSFYGASDYSAASMNLNSNTGSGTIQFYTGTSSAAPTERMRIAGSGEVGIGVSSPDDTLTIGSETLGYGSALSNRTLGIRGGVLGGTGGDSVNLAYFGYESTNNNTAGLNLKAFRTSTGNDWTTTALKFTFNVDNTDPVYDNILVFNSGKIGIGTDSPTGTLSIDSTGGTSQSIITTSTNGSSYVNLEIGGINTSPSIKREITFHTNAASGSRTQRMLLDSSGNLLVNRTTLSGTDNTQGAYIFNEGAFVAQRYSNVALYLNRYGTDGDIALFRKQGSDVGSIKSDSGKLVINSEGSNLVFAVGGTNEVNLDGTQFYPQTDGGIDLGHPSVRWGNGRFTGFVDAKEITYDSFNDGAGASGLNIVAYYSFDNDSANSIGSDFNNRATILYVVTTNGTTAIPMYPNAGGGVAWQVRIFDPDSLVFRNNQVDWVQGGSSGNTFQLITNSGSGAGTIERTAGSLAYQVYICRISGGTA